MKKGSIIVILLLVLGLSGVFSLNFFTIVKPMKSVIQDDYRNSGIEVSVHYDNYINTNVLVFGLGKIGADNSPADIFRVFWQYAQKISDKNFDKVILSSKGKPKFYILGQHFKKMGNEYGNENPIYVVRTFPENVYTMDGQRAFNKWTGGLLGVSSKQMEDFYEFNKEWFINDLLK
ncbi:hypothetical protein ACNO7P_01685 [Bisgaard Taxon 45]